MTSKAVASYHALHASGPMAIPDPHATYSERQRATKRVQYLTECERAVYVALDVLGKNPYAPGVTFSCTARRLKRFLLEGEERILGAPVTIQDVRCGLRRLRKQNALVVRRRGEDTFYELAPHVARAS